jgi:hypothetical protein
VFDWANATKRPLISLILRGLLNLDRLAPFPLGTSLLMKATKPSVVAWT